MFAEARDVIRGETMMPTVAADQNGDARTGEGD